MNGKRVRRGQSGRRDARDGQHSERANAKKMDVRFWEHNDRLVCVSARPRRGRAETSGFSSAVQSSYLRTTIFFVSVLPPVCKR